MSRFAGFSRILAVLVALVLVVGLVVVFGQRDARKTLTVDFAQTNSLYEGSDVRILGVAVGTVDSLTPRGQTVRATISYDGDVKLPADVKAVIVSPSIVGDRFVQLAPAYDGGQVLADDARLGVDRTAVPVELDQIYQSLDDFSVALGPEGANKDGAVSSLVRDTAAQLDGQGVQLNETLRNFGKLSQTLSDNKDELFGSLREVEQFVDTLQTNDQAVRDFFDSTAEVSTVLEGEREDLQATIKALGEALIEVRTLVRDNRKELRGNVKQLATVAAVLGEHQKELEEFTVSAPTALSNVALAYNGDSGTLDNHADVLALVLGAVEDPGDLLCNISEALPVDLKGPCDQVIGPILDGILNPVVGGLPLPRAAVASAPSPDRTATSLDQMLAVDR
jgi:virulence factor Mce-like protein